MRPTGEPPRFRGSDGAEQKQGGERRQRRRRCACAERKEEDARLMTNSDKMPRQLNSKCRMQQIERVYENAAT